jgi:hypothetical protein
MRDSLSLREKMELYPPLDAEAVENFRMRVMYHVDYPDKTYLLAGLAKLADALEEKE